MKYDNADQFIQALPTVQRQLIPIAIRRIFQSRQHLCYSVPCLSNPACHDFPQYKRAVADTPLHLFTKYRQAKNYFPIKYGNWNNFSFLLWKMGVPIWPMHNNLSYPFSLISITRLVDNSERNCAKVANVDISTYMSFASLVLVTSSEILQHSMSKVTEFFAENLSDILASSANVFISVGSLTLHVRVMKLLLILPFIVFEGNLNQDLFSA